MTDAEDAIDWSLTTWEGSRKEQLRRWSLLTADEIFRAQEEMADLRAAFAAGAQPPDAPASHDRAGSRPQPGATTAGSDLPPAS